MHIYTNGEKPLLFPAFTLKKENWDDYNTKSTFTLYFYSTEDNKKIIGRIKIIQKSSLVTKLSNVFSELDSEEYISLGQEIRFYEKLIQTCERKITINFLENICDIAWQPILAEPFETLSSFRNSLLREHSAQKARRFGIPIINKEKVSENFSFTYKTTIPGADNETEVHFDFCETDEVPGRIVGIIGRNATGKTRFLSRLAEDLVKIRRTSLKKEQQREDSFTPQRPIFTRLLALSFSAFDQFSRPETEQISYIYCGIRNKKGTLSRKNLSQRYVDNLKRIRNGGRTHDWLRVIKNTLGTTAVDIVQDISEQPDNDLRDEDKLSKLSSGQAILTHTVTALIAWIEPNSIILFDEPETHLHPNAVASLFSSLNQILETYESYAVIATHSPVVIQEIPGKRVILFTREQNSTVAKPIGIETFGENISELTRHVFDTVEIPPFYKVTLRYLSANYSFEDVMTMFNDNLSMSAQSFLLSQYLEDENEDIE